MGESEGDSSEGGAAYRKQPQGEMVMRIRTVISKVGAKLASMFCFLVINGLGHVLERFEVWYISPGILTIEPSAIELNSD